jgi:nicotinamide riboside kinase
VRIAFSGSGGTGKTTLLTEINKELQLPVIEEGIREWLAEHGFADFKDMSFPTDVVKMQTDTLERKMAIESELQSFIADRTTVDNLTYALRWIGSKAKAGSDMDAWMGQYIAHCMGHANLHYDIIFVLPWGEIEIEDDGTRSTKQWYQYMIQSIIERHLYMLERPFIYEVMSVELDDRIAECTSMINNVDFSVLG